MDNAIVPQRQSEVLPNYDIADLEGLTPNEAKFVSAYVSSGNSTKAYEEIFPNTEDPAKLGRALAKTKKVNKAIEQKEGVKPKGQFDDINANKPKGADTVILKFKDGTRATIPIKDLDTIPKNAQEARALHAKIFRLGDKVHAVAQPIAKVIDKTLGTNIQGCGACAKRREKLNNIFQSELDK